MQYEWVYNFLLGAKESVCVFDDCAASFYDT